MSVCVMEDEHPYTESQLRTAPADERHPHQLSESLVGALVDSNYANLPGACARPDGQPSDGAVKLDRNIRSTTRDWTADC